jgi:CMP-N-acetylneuraminic acid synthetase
VTPGYLREHRSLYGTDMVPLIMNEPGQSLDIDTEWDWRMAEAMLSVRNTQPE